MVVMGDTNTSHCRWTHTRPAIFHDEARKELLPKEVMEIGQRNWAARQDLSVTGLSSSHGLPHACSTQPTDLVRREPHSKYSISLCSNCMCVVRRPLEHESHCSAYFYTVPLKQATSAASSTPWHMTSRIGSPQSVVSPLIHYHTTSLRALLSHHTIELQGTRQ